MTNQVANSIPQVPQAQIMVLKYDFSEEEISVS